MHTAGSRFTFRSNHGILFMLLILSRFIPIVGQVAIAGLLAQKKFIPESAGTLKTDTLTFGVMTFAVSYTHLHCLNRELSEIVVSVKMPITRDGTKRPREPLL